MYSTLYCTLVHCLCTIVQTRISYRLSPIVVISWLKAQRPKFNAYILNLKGPKKIGQGPKFGPGAHGLDSPAVRYTSTPYAVQLDWSETTRCCVENSGSLVNNNEQDQNIVNEQKNSQKSLSCRGVTCPAVPGLFLCMGRETRYFIVWYRKPVA